MIYLVLHLQVCFIVFSVLIIVCIITVKVTVNLLIMGGNSDDMDQLVHAVRSRRRKVKVVKIPADFADVAIPTSFQTVLVETLHNLSPSRKQNLLFLLPW